MHKMRYPDIHPSFHGGERPTPSMFTQCLTCLSPLPSIPGSMRKECMLYRLAKMRECPFTIIILLPRQNKECNLLQDTLCDGPYAPFFASPCYPKSKLGRRATGRDGGSLLDAVLRGAESEWCPLRFHRDRPRSPPLRLSLLSRN